MRKLKKKIILGIVVCFFVCASAVFIVYDSKSKPTSEDLIERKLSAEEFNEMNDIIKKVNSGELPVAALKDAEVLIKRNSYYVKPDILKAYNELVQ